MARGMLPTGKTGKVFTQIRSENAWSGSLQFHALGGKPDRYKRGDSMEDQTTERATSPETSAPSVETGSTQEQVASLAYALWQQRGCPEGSAEEDWLRAEQELMSF